METNEFYFSGAFGRDFLFGRRTGGCAFAKGKKAACVTVVVIMSLMGGINIKFVVSKKVHKKRKTKVTSGQ
jgi:hypothetical protein